MLAGVCSVTFRHLGVDEVIEVVGASGLDAIEWGADVHLPPGDLTEAEALRRRACDAGVVSASYGSYLQPGRSDPAEEAFVLETAKALGAPMVRVWARGSDRSAVVEGLARVAGAAHALDLTVALEYHPGTYTETAASTLALLADVGAPNLLTHWQPDPELTDEDNLAALEAIAPHLAHLHVFAWEADRSRLDLEAGEQLWTKAFAAADAVDRVAFLEFVRNDDVEQFRRDVATLRSWIA
ncbi:MAG TPA: sugar phosphate isomerase/epimerase [Acidimicrobiales bacterium]|jgi:3-dehydroshikimate dehydratase|nr:sugar phosphate isomerase/epimerase [Acidimicrobiales bacterium]